VPGFRLLLTVVAPKDSWQTGQPYTEWRFRRGGASPQGASLEAGDGAGR
jgi:hypothetical protein